MNSGTMAFKANAQNGKTAPIIYAFPRLKDGVVSLREKTTPLSNARQIARNTFAITLVCMSFLGEIGAGAFGYNATKSFIEKNFGKKHVSQDIGSTDRMKFSKLAPMDELPQNIGTEK